MDVQVKRRGGNTPRWWNDESDVFTALTESIVIGDFEMATRGVIARKTSGGWQGVYHHWDSYPSSLGKTLFSLYRGHFNKDIAQMTHVLIDEHSAGWSNIVDTDFSLSPGFVENYQSNDPPQCYCHGDRHEPDNLLTAIPRWCEYLYVINEETSEMDVFAGATHLATVDLDAAEPVWRALD